MNFRVVNEKKPSVCQYEQWNKAEKQMGICGKKSVLMAGRTPLCMECGKSAAISKSDVFFITVDGQDKTVIEESFFQFIKDNNK